MHAASSILKATNTERLVIIGGGLDGEQLTLPVDGAVRYGSDSGPAFAECGLRPEHFQLQRRGRFLLLTDLSGVPGTWVNGHRIASHLLHDGDSITAGDLRLRFASPHSATPLQHIAPSVRTLAASSVLPAKDILDDVGLSGRILLAREMDVRTDLSTSFARRCEGSESITRLRTALDTIYSVSNLVLAEDNLDRLFSTVMDVVMDAIRPDRAYLIMWDGQSGDMRHAVMRQRPDADVARLASAAAPSKGVVRESILKSLALMTEDAQIDPRFRTSQSVQAMGIRSAMCVPVRSATQRIGALYVDHLSALRSFAEHELELLAAIGRQAGLAIERARVYDDMESLFYSCVRALVTAIEAKDVYTHGHSERVASFAMSVAQELGVDSKTLNAVRLGALLHDIGKIGVPENILCKPGRLTDEEYAVIREHPSRGAEILSHIKNIPDVIAAVRWHHEMVNGGGYPDGLVGEAIPLPARIVCVADAFDAMTSNRAYRRNLSVPEAIEEFRRAAGVQFDADVCSAMVRLLEDGRVIPCNDLYERGVDVRNKVYLNPAA